MKLVLEELSIVPLLYGALSLIKAYEEFQFENHS